MKRLGLTSRYALTGLLFAVLCLWIGSQVNRPLIEPEFSRQIIESASPAAPPQLSKTPCFVASIDPQIPGYGERYRTDLFEGVSTDMRELLAEDLETALVAEIEQKTWRRSYECFEATFVVTFQLTEDGYMGPTMLVHHVRGGASDAGLTVLDELTRLRNEGHQWRVGKGPAGKVSIPFRFRLQ